MKTRFFSFLVLALLITGLVFAGGGADRSQSQSVSGGPRPAGAGPAERGGIQLPIVDREITLTCFWEADPKATAVIPSYERMAYFEEMRRYTGINVEFLHPPAGQTDQQFALMLSTNDLPDMVWYYWDRVPGGVGALLQDGTIQNLTQWTAEHSPNIMNLYDRYPDMRKEALLADGTFYNYPRIKEDSSILVTTGNQIRKDWLDRLGLSVPVTIDDWYNVLTQFKNRDANGNGNPNDEIPFVSAAVLTAFDNAWNLRWNNFSVRGDTVVFGPILPEFREFVETMRRWYAEGLIDPDYLATDSRALEAKIVGDVGGAYRGTINGNMGRFFDVWEANNQPGRELIPVAHARLRAGANAYNTVQNYTGLDGMVITNSNRYPRESMQFLDLGYSPWGSFLCNYGVEGRSYTIVNGRPQFTDIILNHPSEPVINALHLFGFAVSQGPVIQMSDTFIQTATRQQMRDAYPVFGADHTAINLPKIELTAEEGTRNSRIMGDVNTFVEERVNRFVMGIEPMSNFDAFVAQIRAMNIQEAIAIQQAALNRFNAK